MRIEFESDDNLLLGKILNIPLSVIFVKSAFQENDKYYPHFFFNQCFYEYEHKSEDDSYIIY